MQAQILAGPGYTTPPVRNDSLAILATITGVIALPVPLVFVLPILFGHLALRRLRTSYDSGHGLAVVGLTLGYVSAAGWLGIYLLANLPS